LSGQGPATEENAARTHNQDTFESVADIGCEGLNILESAAGPFLLILPDTCGAGNTQIVQIVNSALAIYDKESGARLRRLSLNHFFGHPPPPPGSSFPHPRVLFDPRVVYDRTWNRWIVTAEAFTESSRAVSFHWGFANR